MPSTLWPTAYRRTKPATRSPRVILRTKEIENAKKSILIGRSRRLGSESETIAKANDFLSKTQHSSCIAAGALERSRGNAYGALLNLALNDHGDFAQLLNVHLIYATFS